jgi:hypothetical protein
MKKSAKALVNESSKTSKPAAKAKKTETTKPAPAKRLRGK